MNLLARFQQGLKGGNIGLPSGLNNIDKKTGGVQKAAIYVVAAGPKVGKSTFVDFSFILGPYLHYLEELKKGNPNNLKLRWIYFSFEIDRVKKEFKYIAFFLNVDYNLTEFNYKGSIYEINANYLMGKTVDIAGDPIMVLEEHRDLVHKIYKDRIIPLFGEWTERNELVKPGLIEFIEERDNPTGLRNYLGRYSSTIGTWRKSTYRKEVGRDSEGQPIYEDRQKRESWSPNDPNLQTIIVTDHMRKLKEERKYSKKQLVDKMTEYQVEFRNWCGFTFVDIIHLNRGLGDVSRLKYNNEFIYPTGDDIKETGNLSEDADYVFTMMNPNDDKYGLSKHFGLQIKTKSNDEIYPNYVSVHLVESRDTECPLHFRTSMYGGSNMFTPLEESSDYGFTQV